MSIQRFEITEKNLRAVKDISDFGGPNMWNLYIQNVKGYWENVQWMSHRNIQQFFTTKLPSYKEADTKQKIKYELE
jgi:hypothetical protein